MKHLKIFEKVKEKNLKIGNIYRCGYSTQLNGDNISLVKIIEFQNDGMLLVKSYFKDNLKEHITRVSKNWIKNIASPSEIIEFNTIEQSKKYNL